MNPASPPSAISESPDPDLFNFEVKGGQIVDVQVPEGEARHLQTARFGQNNEKMGNKNVLLYFTVDDKKLVAGSLHPHDRPKHDFNLMFDRDFKLSHSLKEGSVIFTAFKNDDTFFTFAYSDESSDEDDEEKRQHLPKEEEGRKSRKSCNKR